MAGATIPAAFRSAISARSSRRHAVHLSSTNVTSKPDTSIVAGAASPRRSCTIRPGCPIRRLGDTITTTTDQRVSGGHGFSSRPATCSSCSPASSGRGARWARRHFRNLDGQRRPSSVARLGQVKRGSRRHLVQRQRRHDLNFVYQNIERRLPGGNARTARPIARPSRMQIDLEASRSSLRAPRSTSERQPLCCSEGRRP